jgi:hypothetical protein
MITIEPPAQGMRVECHLRDGVEAAFRRARTTGYDVRPHDQPGPLVRFRRPGHTFERPICDI